MKVSGLNKHRFSKHLMSIHYVSVPKLGAGEIEINQTGLVPALMEVESSEDSSSGFM